MSQMKRSKLAVTDAAARLRAGESLDAVAADADITRHTLMDRLGKAGFSTDGTSRSSEQRSELRTYLSSALLRWHEPWMAEAICAQTDPEAFYPEKGEATADAKRICQGCPVRQVCLEYAMEHKELFGVWGGLSVRDRRKLSAGQVAA